MCVYLRRRHAGSRVTESAQNLRKHDPSIVFILSNRRNLRHLPLDGRSRITAFRESPTNYLETLQLKDLDKVITVSDGDAVFLRWSETGGPSGLALAFLPVALFGRTFKSWKSFDEDAAAATIFVMTTRNTRVLR